MKKVLHDIPTAILIVVIIVASALLIIKILHPFPTKDSLDTSVTEGNVNKTEIIEAKTSRSIAIPGCEKMQLIARQREQNVYFYNPSRNNCYFEITLLLPGGEELFHSGLLAPGKTIESISLNYLLEPGIYTDSTLVYTCYAIGDMSPLNGANISFDLEVTQ